MYTRLIILFGSHATGAQHARSDADVAVLSDHPLDIDEKIDVARGLAGQLQISEDRLDIVDIWNAPPLLQYEIAKHGKLLQGTAFDFTRFKVLAWKRYQDTAKFRRARVKGLEAFIKQ